MNGRKYLSLQHRTYWFVRAIPGPVRSSWPAPDTGKSNWKRNLHTADLKTAQRVRAKALAEYELSFAIAERRRVGEPSQDLDDQAEGWREFWEVVGDEDVMRKEVERVKRDHGAPAADRFRKIAVGQMQTPFDRYVDQWLIETPRTPRTDMERRRIVQDVSKWRPSLAVETLDKRIAREFVMERLVPAMAAITVNKHLSSLSGYHKWLTRSGVTSTENPWTAQRRAVTKKVKGADDQRPFTDAELRKLLAGDCRGDLKDAIRIGALSGMRLDETARLRVSDLDLDAMIVAVPGTKTPNAARRIPLHSNLKAIFERRVFGKNDRDWVFPELPVYPKGSPMERSMVWSKAFGRYRTALGVDERVEGSRRSRVSYHSLRHYFATALERAGADPWVIATALGHSRQGVTMGTYAQGLGLEQMRQLFEKVRLP